MKHFFYYTSFLTCFFWFINLCPSLKHTDAPAITDGLCTSLCSLLSGCKYPCGISKRRKHKTKLCKLMIKQLLNSVLAKYRDLSVSRRSIICLCLRHRQIIDLLATDKLLLLLLTLYLSRIPTSPKCFSVGSCNSMLHNFKIYACINYSNNLNYNLNNNLNYNNLQYCTIRYPTILYNIIQYNLKQ